MKSKGNDFTKTIRALYDEYTDDSLKTRLEMYALWTLPSVFPTGEITVDNGNAEIEHDYQSVGAYLVNRLASRLASTLFPVSTSFFRIEPSQELKDLVDKRGTSTLIDLENKACRRLFFNASYAQIVQALRLLIITGEVLLLRRDNRLRVFSLKNYALLRNNVGEVLEIITREPKRYRELDAETQELLQDHNEDETLDLYTRIRKRNINGVISWKITQEIDGVRLPNYEIYRDKLCPYIPVTWSYMNGDAYGRGYVEEYAGDFAKLSELSQGLTEYQIESLIIRHVYNAQGGFDVESAVNSRNGDWISGNVNAVQNYESGSYQKMNEVRLGLEAIMQRLNVAFMYTGNMREGDRVTAYEIARNADEAEQVLGGVYSQLSQNMHLPLAYLLLYEVRKDFIQAIDRQEIELNILTGLQALSRSSENQALLVAANEIATVAQVFSQVSKRFNLDAIVDKILLSNGIDISEITYSEEEMRAKAMEEQRAAEAQRQQVIQQAGAQLGGNQLENTQAAQLAAGIQ
ncbi:head-tail adaptor [Acinetobacter phage vB_AbaP_Tama]